MSPVRVTASRTLKRMRSLYSFAFSIAAFLAACSALFAFNLDAFEGGRITVASVWAVSVSPFLPVLAAFLAMDVWSDERQSGRIDILLSSPVKERDLALGKFLGVYIALVATILASLVMIFVLLRMYAPDVLSGLGVFGLCPAFTALALQGALWCAVSVATSAMFSHAATAACASLALLVGLPRGGWHALLAWGPSGRTAFGEMPLDAHVLDMSSGLVSTGTVLSYLVLSVLALFISTKAVAYLRFSGRGAKSLRFSTRAAVLLSVVFALLTVVLACQLDVKLDIPVGDVESTFSARTHSILRETHGEMTATCFMPRRDARFREVARLLRAFRSESASLGGVRIDLRYVDPRWDVGPAERMVRLGVPERSVVFARGRRMMHVPVSEGFGERDCASAILRLTMPPQRRNVYWTVGHGETSFSEYGSWGMSDMARDLSRDGYRNAVLDLASCDAIPSDCALIVVAGAKDDFSHAETGRIDTYLRGGGRMLVLTSSINAGGISSLLPSWGIRATSAPLAGARTVSGTDVVVGDFSEHMITKPLDGSRILLESPVAFMPSAAAEAGTGADRIEFTSLARAGNNTVAAVVERGSGAGADLSIRPTRIVAIGDSGFAVNGQLAARANANRDFLLNCVAYLSGTDASVASGTEAGTFVTGLDRSGKMGFATLGVALIPSAALLFLVLVAYRRNHRS